MKIKWGAEWGIRVRGGICDRWGSDVSSIVLAQGTLRTSLTGVVKDAKL